MKTAKRWIRDSWFRMRGKDPEAVVVTFLSGEPERCCDLLEEVRRLLPDRRHFAVSLGDAETPPKVVHIRLDRAVEFLIGDQL